MIEEFNKLLEGVFENRTQALSNPSKYAYIRVTHVPIFDGMFYGEQAYNYKLAMPYRQFVLQPVLENDQIRIINFEIEGKEQFAGAKNLDNLKKHMFSVKSGCDVVMKKTNDGFEGGTTGCNCLVDWMGKATYLKNEIKLTSTHYYVLDMGLDVNTNKQIWGSRYGRFEFVRMPV